MNTNLNSDTLVEDVLVDFREAQRMLGSRCKTSHYALSLARRGLIRAVRLNERSVKFSRRSILELIARGGMSLPHHAALASGAPEKLRADGA